MTKYSFLIISTATGLGRYVSILTVICIHSARVIIISCICCNGGRLPRSIFRKHPYFILKIDISYLLDKEDSLFLEDTE